MTGTLALLGTGASVPAGVLTFPAWQVLREAGVVLGGDGLDPDWEQALAEAGVPVRLVAPRSPQALAAGLLTDASVGEAVVWFVSADGDPGLGDALTRELVRRSSTGEVVPEVEMVLGSWDVAGSGLLDLVRVMDRLRSPGGCPWDAAQTHESLLPYALEEAYEVADAVESGDRAHLLEELGDLLLQVVFHARVASEHPDAPFDVDDVAEGIVAKLVRRHPHVFTTDPAGAAGTAAEVETRWEQIKQAEKGRESGMDGVPVALPALARADKVLGRLERTGLGPDELPAVPGMALPDDLGAHLLGLVAAARRAGVDAEGALRRAVRSAELAARAADLARAENGAGA